MRSRRDIPTAALAVALTLAFLSACEGAPARSKPWRHHREPEVAHARPALLAEDEARSAARRERARTLAIHLDADPRHLAPMVAPTVWTERIVSDTVFETLIRHRPPEGGAGAGPGRYLPGLASSWKVAPGGREIRVELRPDVQFHDGRRMTSVDVQFSLDAARRPRTGAAHLRAHLRDVSAVEIVGPRAIRIRLHRPNGYVLRALAEVPILPQHVYERDLEGRRAAVVGTGPYRLAGSAGDDIRLERWPDYRGDQPAIEQIVFVREMDAARALGAARSGEIDLVSALIPAHYPEQASAPGMDSAFEPLRLSPPVFRYLVFNTRRPPFDAEEVRRAISLLVPRADIARDAHGGLARPVAGPVWPGGPGDGAAPDPPPPSPDAAAELLDRSGWRQSDDSGGRRHEVSGRRLMVMVLAAEEDSAEQRQVISALERAGFVVDLRVGSPAVLRNRLRDGAFDLAFVEWSGSVDRDLSPLLETGGDLNFGGFSDERVDRLLAAARGAYEPRDRSPILAELARLLVELEPVVALPAPDPYGLLGARVRGAVPWDGWVSLRELVLAPAAAAAGE